MFSQPPELGREGCVQADEGGEQCRQWEGRWGLGCGVSFHRAQMEAGAGALILAPPHQRARSSPAPCTRRIAES